MMANASFIFMASTLSRKNASFINLRGKVELQNVAYYVCRIKNHLLMSTFLSLFFIICQLIRLSSQFYTTPSLWPSALRFDLKH